MPDYRKLHNGHGNSLKLSKLTDYEFRVWNQYRATADDFGVCPFLPAKLQGDNRRLATHPPAKVLKAMKRLIEVELVVPFDHQGQTFICSLNWQDKEDIKYPRKSLNPLPTFEVFLLCSTFTRNLFQKAENYFESSLATRVRAYETQTFTQTQTETKTQTETGGAESLERTTWDRIRDSLQPVVGAHTFATWFMPCRQIGEYPDALRVAVPNKFFLEWIPKHYSIVLGEVCQQVIPGKSLRFELLERKAS